MEADPGHVGAGAGTLVRPAADRSRDALPDGRCAGEFAVCALAGGGGDLAFASVMFARRLAACPRGENVTLHVDVAENVPEGGVAVLCEGGFAPSAEGMTLVVAADGPGRFLVRGRYTVAAGAQ